MGQTISVSDVEINGFMLSVTTRRNAEDKPELVEELTARSIAAWLWIVNMLENDKWDASVDVPSVEESYAKASGSPITETFGDSRVTIWDTWRSKQRFGFRLNSDDKPQDAVATHRAHVAGIKKAVDKWNADHPYSGIPNRPQNAPQAPNTSATPPTVPDAPATPKNAPNAQNAALQSSEIIVATRAPKSSEVQYADGQLVSFVVNRIELGSNKGSSVFKMWTALGSPYPTVSVYMKDTKGALKRDYEAIKPTIDGLGFGIDNIEAHGNWKLVTKVAHAKDKDGNVKEYFNAISLTAI